jgi:hypothetical protein
MISAMVTACMQNKEERRRKEKRGRHDKRRRGITLFMALPMELIVTELNCPLCRT